MLPSHTPTRGVVIQYADVPCDVAVDVGGGGAEEDLQPTLKMGI